mgnify:CR=1 FL=1
MSTARQWDASLVDGQVLTYDIKGLTFQGKEYNMHIVPSKYEEEVNEAFRELLLLKTHAKDEDIEIGLDEDETRGRRMKALKF